MNVLVAVDMSPESDKVLRFASELAEQTGGNMHVVHVITKGEKDEREHRPGPSHYVDVMLAEFESEIETRLGELGMAKSSGTVVVRLGSPVEEIQRVAAENDADVLVVGMSRRSRVGKLLLGSSFQELLLSSDRPVFAIPIEALD